MNYIEYKAKDNVSRATTVLFNPDVNKEFSRHDTIRSGGDILTRWNLQDDEMGWCYEYIEVNQTGRLFTTDPDGNPSQSSCFQLEAKYVASYIKEYVQTQRLRNANIVESFATIAECVKYLKSLGCRWTKENQLKLEKESCFLYNGLLTLFDPYNLLGE